MKITPIKTDKIVPGRKLCDILDRYVKKIPERSILAVTSKIVSICEGRIAPVDSVDKTKLIEEEADYFLPLKQNKYNVILTIKNNMLIPSAGVDESNGNGSYILWPRDSRRTANEIRVYLTKRFKKKNIGVIITDSRTSPLRWGTTGTVLAHSGFSALNDYIGKPDIFRRKLKMTKANVSEGLAAAAVLAIGEGNEQTPLALIEDVPFVHFQTRNPSSSEVKELSINPKDDLYASLLRGVSWRKGKKKRD
ncbi:MAG: coenzyme F420-0:L-glutamate ligase [Candidatus Liptonbacteria bacterium]|nr:coenzyme F420-0:L-glutamate ligase [Candidatus Liptonbacteria bacterium]